MEFNHISLQASAYQLLGEIYLKRTNEGISEANATAKQYLWESLQLYRQLTHTQNIEEVENLLSEIREY